MERWKANLIDRIIRESGHTLEPYGLAIRLQQQLGMSWKEATAISGYDDRPRRVYSPKSELPHSVLTTDEIIRRVHNSEWVEWKREQLRWHQERLKIRPEDRINELMRIMKAREQLLIIRDTLWQGIGSVDEDPTVDYNSHTGEYIGVLMLCTPTYPHQFTEYVTCKVYKGMDMNDSGIFEDVVERSTTKVVEDFASVRIGVFLPYLLSEPCYFAPVLDAERIGVLVLKSNLREHYQDLPTGGPDYRRLETYAPCRIWPSVYPNPSGEVRNLFRVLQPEENCADVLERLLKESLDTTSIDVSSLMKPLETIQPARKNPPWYRRLLG